MNECNSGTKNNDRFIRWQSTLRDQLTFLNNLLMTFSVGITGFSISLLKEKDFNPFYYDKLWFTSGLCIVFFSIIFGLLTALNRLSDFRGTLKKIKGEEQINSYGDRTWCLFYWQVGTLSAGVLLLLLAFSRIYFEKLF